MLALVIDREWFLLPAASGAISTFGGPDDTGVRPDETGAVTGERLRDLDPRDYYIAMRWGYVQGPFTRAGSAKDWLAQQRVVVRANGRAVVCRIVDWGPSVYTGRVADLSPGAARYLGLDTDDRARFEFVLPGVDVGPFQLEEEMR